VTHSNPTPTHPLSDPSYHRVSPAPGVCVLLLSASTVSAVSLSVSPNLQQVFSGSSPVSLSCDDGWTVRRTRGNQTDECGPAADFRRLNESLCVQDLQTTFTAIYWCETSSGQKSDEVTISVSEKGVILEIPALPVIKGSNLTLRCRLSTGDTVAAYFFYSGRRLVSGHKEHTISNVQQSNEGFYWCATDLSGSSAHSYLRVRDPPTTSVRSSVRSRETMSPIPSLPPPPTNCSSPRPPPAPSSCAPVLRLLSHLLAFCIYSITTGLLLSICLDRLAARRSGNRLPVSVEMTQCIEQNYEAVVDITGERALYEDSEYSE
uniref:Immunoglobulin domain-containing protein n=1 Tax=Oreochromis aureus TaxID=47969 RepID=A0A668VYB0_OREAU